MGIEHMQLTSAACCIAEVLDPEINTWMGVKMMSQARFSTTASSINGAVYVVGGFNGEAYLKSAEMLDPRTGRWQQVSEAASVCVCVCV